jgi:hypothetical protein
MAARHSTTAAAMPRRQPHAQRSARDALTVRYELPQVVRQVESVLWQEDIADICVSMHDWAQVRRAVTAV